MWFRGAVVGCVAPSRCENHWTCQPGLCSGVPTPEMIVRWPGSWNLKKIVRRTHGLDVFSFIELSYIHVSTQGTYQIMRGMIFMLREPSDVQPELCSGVHSPNPEGDDRPLACALTPKNIFRTAHRLDGFPPLSCPIIYLLKQRTKKREACFFASG